MSTAARPPKAALHPRNRHQGRYDFPALIKICPELARFVIINPYGKPSIDFANPEAVKVFNRALLRQHYGLRHWDIPAGYLCPPIPGRADYLHGLADLLAGDNGNRIPQGSSIRVLDVGSGANCIYPLIGLHEYGWRFVGADIDATALQAAAEILRANHLQERIELRQQADPAQIFQGIIQPDERFELTLCNPPFHASADEALSGSQRKWRNLGKLDPKRALPLLNFGGQSNELHCPGGEAAFIDTLACESAQFATQVYRFSTLVSKASNLPGLEGRLKALGARDIRTTPMAQGQKQSRFVSWTFLTPKQREAWRKDWKDGESG